VSAFWRLNEWLLLALVFLALAAALELGFRLGRRRHDPTDAHIAQHVTSLQAAALTLLALLLGFTFAMAVSRYDARKSLVQAQANAIGTAALRAQFLPEAERNATLRLFGQYADARLDEHLAGSETARAAVARARAAAIESTLWSQARSAAQAEPQSLPLSLYVQSMNELIDDAEMRQAARENHVPAAVVALLMVVAAVAFGLVGFGCGLTRHRRSASNLMFGALMALVITVTLDVDRPRQGLVQVSPEALIRLRDVLATHIDQSAR
jgi:hypothetical protein